MDKAKSGLSQKEISRKINWVFNSTGYRTTATGIQWSNLTRRSPTNEERGGQTSA